MIPEEYDENPGKEQGKIVFSAHMISLMQEDIFPVFRIGRSGKIDPGTEQSSDKSSGNLIGFPDIRLVRFHRKADAFADPEKGADRQDGEDHDAQKPDQRKQSGQKLHIRERDGAFRRRGRGGRHNVR